MKVGIVPAAGDGSRWNGFHKMLLPTGPQEYLIDRTIKAMLAGGANTINVVYSESTLPVLKAHLADRYDSVRLVKQQNPQDMWGAIWSGILTPADYYYFGMPDTFYPLGVFDEMSEINDEFQMGVFETWTPSRFGVYHPEMGAWVNKADPGMFFEGPPVTAWGVLGWSAKVAQAWKANPNITNYTQAINTAWINFRPSSEGVHVMNYYYDMSNFDDYVNFLKEKYSG